MVDVVMARGGIVDKYIDDAVMAILRHAVKHEDDEMRSVLTAFDMLEAADRFNREQKNAGRSEFRTSIGISYGVVTVGNIGCDKENGLHGDRRPGESRIAGAGHVQGQHGSRSSSRAASIAR